MRVPGLRFLNFIMNFMSCHFLYVGARLLNKFNTYPIPAFSKKKLICLKPTSWSGAQERVHKGQQVRLRKITVVHEGITAPLLFRCSSFSPTHSWRNNSAGVWRSCISRTHLSCTLNSSSISSSSQLSSQSLSPPDLAAPGAAPPRCARSVSESFQSKMVSE